ncbi:hypothetical protein DFJ73DRAFT_798692 [Zopfochytrium polystomum]|nr:hypothetical protein DFJ73DRAFT_798692 [Zopfochytrium polystomum]
MPDLDGLLTPPPSGNSPMLNERQHQHRHRHNHHRRSFSASLSLSRNVRMQSLSSMASTESSSTTTATAMTDSVGGEPLEPDPDAEAATADGAAAVAAAAAEPSPSRSASTYADPTTHSGGSPFASGGLRRHVSFKAASTLEHLERTSSKSDSDSDNAPLASVLASAAAAAGPSLRFESAGRNGDDADGDVDDDEDEEDDDDDDNNPLIDLVHRDRPTSLPPLPLLLDQGHSGPPSPISAPTTARASTVSSPVSAYPPATAIFPAPPFGSNSLPRRRPRQKLIDIIDERQSLRSDVLALFGEGASPASSSSSLGSSLPAPSASRLALPPSSGSQLSSLGDIPPTVASAPSTPGSTPRSAGSSIVGGDDHPVQSDDDEDEVPLGLSDNVPLGLAFPRPRVLRTSTVISHLPPNYTASNTTKQIFRPSSDDPSSSSSATPPSSSTASATAPYSSSPYPSLHTLPPDLSEMLRAAAADYFRLLEAKDRIVSGSGGGGRAATPGGMLAGMSLARPNASSRIQRNLVRSLESVAAEIRGLRNEIEYHGAVESSRRTLFTLLRNRDGAGNSYDVAAAKERLAMLVAEEAAFKEQLSALETRVKQLQHIETRMEDLCSNLFVSTAGIYPKEAFLKNQLRLYKERKAKCTVVVASLGRARVLVKTVISQLGEALSSMADGDKATALLFAAEGTFQNARSLVSQVPAVEGLEIIAAVCFEPWDVTQPNVQAIQAMLGKTRGIELVLREDEARAASLSQRFSDIIKTLQTDLQNEQASILLHILAERDRDRIAREEERLGSGGSGSGGGGRRTAGGTSSSSQDPPPPPWRFDSSSPPPSPPSSSSNVIANSSIPTSPPRVFYTRTGSSSSSSSSLRRRHSLDSISIAASEDSDMPPSYASIMSTTAPVVGWGGGVGGGPFSPSLPPPLTALVPPGGQHPRGSGVPMHPSATTAGLPGHAPPPPPPAFSASPSSPSFAARFRAAAAAATTTTTTSPLSSSFTPSSSSSSSSTRSPLNPPPPPPPHLQDDLPYRPSPSTPSSPSTTTTTAAAAAARATRSPGAGRSGLDIGARMARRSMDSRRTGAAGGGQGQGQGQQQRQRMVWF